MKKYLTVQEDLASFDIYDANTNTLIATFFNKDLAFAYLLNQEVKGKDEPKFTIQDLADGECAARNDSGLNTLREVLSKAFPLDLCLISGASDIYLKGMTTKWRGSDETHLPIQSAKDFLNL